MMLSRYTCHVIVIQRRCKPSADAGCLSCCACYCRTSVCILRWKVPSYPRSRLPEIDWFLVESIDGKKIPGSKEGRVCWINRVWLPMSWWKLNRKIFISLSPVTPENLVLRDARVRPSSPLSARLFSTLRLNLVPAHGVSTALFDRRRRQSICMMHVCTYKPSTAIGSVPNMSGYATCGPIVAFIARSPPVQGQ